MRHTLPEPGDTHAHTRSILTPSPCSHGPHPRAGPQCEHGFPRPVSPLAPHPDLLALQVRRGGLPEAKTDTRPPAEACEADTALGWGRRRAGPGSPGHGYPLTAGKTTASLGAGATRGRFPAGPRRAQKRDTHACGPSQQFIGKELYFALKMQPGMNAHLAQRGLCAAVSASFLRGKRLSNGQSAARTPRQRLE